MPGLTDLALRILIGAEDRTGPAFRTVRQGTQSISDSFARLETAAKRFLDIKIFAGFAQEAITLADNYRTLQARLQLVSDNTHEFAAANAELFNIAQRTRSELDATYNVYGKLETAVKQLGGTQSQALRTTETLNQAIALTSQGAAQNAAAILQFSQALGSGVLRGDEFNSVMENSPGLAQALADGLDVPIGKLRGMAEAGELTADKLINALGKSAPQIAEQFAKLPVTVSAAMTQVNNALLKFVGESNNANSAVNTLSSGLQLLAGNLNAVANVALILAEVYAARLVAGLFASTKAYFANAQAARQLAIADEQARLAALALLQTEAQLATVSLRVAQNAVQEARLQAALARTATQRAEATRLLNIELTRLHASEARLTAANTVLAGSTQTAAATTGLLARGFSVLGNALNGAFAAFIAYDIGRTIGEWLRQFDSVRIAGTYIAETLALMVSGAQALLDGVSFSERLAQIKQIHADFDVIRAAEISGNQASAQAAEQAEQQKTQAIEQAALKQQQAFAQVQESTKALTATIDAESKAQSAAIQQALTDRIAAIDAANISDAVKDAERIDAKLTASAQELQIQREAANAKLQLIEQEYAAGKKVKDAQKALDAKVATKYAQLSEVEIKTLVVDDKWLAALATSVQSELDRVSQALTGRDVSSNWPNATPRHCQNCLMNWKRLLPASTGISRRWGLYGTEGGVQTD